MKSVFRSCLDPLPRMLTLRSLTMLVGMLVLGVVFSVWEFLESGQIQDHRVLANDANSSWSAPRCTAARQSCSIVDGNGKIETSSTSCVPCPAASTSPAASSAQPADPSPPSVFDPSRASAGG